MVEMETETTICFLVHMFALFDAGLQLYIRNNVINGWKIEDENIQDE